ncbi:glycosyltransferase family 4 protein [Algoriphagus sp.]|uniref:glycosyltransferase family 4 protein n=1 Tax=Algoriphagus sp. TaxID=1872435 RepID=UPI00257A8027|nr:glycosyltransferase family 4 protein [Algoriphagus sp.]
MKIYLISNMYPSEKSPNFGVFVKNFEEGIQSEDVQIIDKTIIQGKKKGILLLLAYVKFFIECVYKLNKGEFDLVYVHFLQHSLVPLHFWLNSSSKKMVLNAHGTDITASSPFYRILRKWNLSLIRHADLIIIPSDFFRQKIEGLGVKRERIKISPSGGVKKELFYPINFQEINRGTLGYVGRLDPGKGVDTLIHAFSELPTDKLNLEICGPGILKNDLSAICVNLGIQDRVKFLGNVPQTQLRAIFENWDALVFPSQLEESLGLVGIEAMACGLPVIGTAMGGMESYLKNGANGIIFESGNVKDLKEKILEFYGLENESREELSRNATVTAKQYYSEQVNERLRQWLRELFYA